MLSLFKGKIWRNIKSGQSSMVSRLFYLRFLPFYNWQILFFIAAMFPFVLVSILLHQEKDERNLLNDLAGIAIFALAGMGSYYFSDRTFDEKIWWVALYQAYFFVGTTLYVKSMMRERKIRFISKPLLFSCALCARLLVYPTICLITCFCASVNSCYLFTNQRNFRLSKSV